MKKQTIYFKIDAQGNVQNKEASAKVRDYFKANPNKEIKVTLHEKQRSNKQNRYYWGVVIPLVVKGINEFGNDFNNEEIHEYLKRELGGLKAMFLPDDTVVHIPISTTELSTSDFEDYTMRIRSWAQETLNLIIPLPNENII